MYKEDEDFRLHIQTHMALAFLPSDEVHTFATSLHQQYTDNTAIEQFHAYFSNTWLTGSSPVELWNQYSVDSQLRTNKAVESRHARFNRALRTAHSNLFIIVKHLKREECATASAIRQAEMGCPPAK